MKTATATRDILDPTPQRFRHRNLRKINDTYTLLGCDPEVCKKLEAENFILRGPNGAERGRLGVAPNGYPFLVLLNKNSKPSVSLGKLYGHASRRIQGKLITFGDGPSEGYYDKDGKPRATVPYNQWLKERMTDVQKAGKPAESLVVLFDDTGNVFWSMP